MKNERGDQGKTKRMNRHGRLYWFWVGLLTSGLLCSFGLGWMLRGDVREVLVRDRARVLLAPMDSLTLALYRSVGCSYLGDFPEGVLIIDFDYLDSLDSGLALEVLRASAGGVRSLPAVASLDAVASEVMDQSAGILDSVVASRTLSCMIEGGVVSLVEVDSSVLGAVKSLGWVETDSAGESARMALRSRLSGIGSDTMLVD